MDATNALETTERSATDAAAVAVQRFERVAVASLSAVLPPHVVTSAELESRLEPVYQRLGLPEGRLELMTGIQERRFFAPGTRPGGVSSVTARAAIEASGVPRNRFGMLIHGSVCRDQMEPATAAAVHEDCDLPPQCQFLDVSNACLGLVGSAQYLATAIELGHIDAGVAVGTEVGRPLVEDTVDAMNADRTLTRRGVKNSFASLTIGSGSAALVLCRRDLAPDGSVMNGLASRADTGSSRLCAGGADSGTTLMETDSEALLHAGVALASQTWDRFAPAFSLHGGRLDRMCTHQVGTRHRRLLLDTLSLGEELDFPTVERFGNTGSCALPMAAALAADAGHLRDGDRAAWLGIGSGLTSQMVAFEWGRPAVAVRDLAVEPL